MMLTRCKLPLLAVGMAFAAAVSNVAQAAEVTIRAQTALPAKHDLSKSFLELFVAPLNEAGKGVVENGSAKVGHGSGVIISLRAA